MDRLPEINNEAEFYAVLALMVENGSESARKLMVEFLDRPENLIYFSLLFTDHISLAVPPFHKELYNLYVQDGFKAAAAPRGFAKSTITSLVTVLWKVLTGRRHFPIILSDTYTQARLFLDTIKNEIETNGYLKWLYGVEIGEVWSEGDIIIRTNDVTRFGRIMAKGAGMKIRGLKWNQYRPDMFEIDDLENDELVASEERRQDLYNWLVRSVIPALAVGGEIIYVGTILHYDALLKKVTDRVTEFQGWKVLKFKAIQDDGTSLWPQLYSVEFLYGMRDDPNNPKYIGIIAFAQEMQNEPMDEGTRIFRVEWLQNKFSLADMQTQFQQAKNDPNDLQTWVDSYFRRIIGAVDPAISEKTMADYFAMITIGIARHDGHIWILDYFRDRIGDILVQTDVILQQYELWRHDTIKIETVAYQAGLYNLVQRIGAERNIRPPLAAVKPDKDKERRAKIHSANFSGGLVHIRQDHALYGAFISEITEFPLGKHDDMLDGYMNAAEESVQWSKPRSFSQKPAGF